jgi:hypothetical protein
VRPSSSSLCGALSRGSGRTLHRTSVKFGTRDAAQQGVAADKARHCRNAPSPRILLSDHPDVPRGRSCKIESWSRAERGAENRDIAYTQHRSGLASAFWGAYRGLLDGRARVVGHALGKPAP